MNVYNYLKKIYYIKPDLEDNHEYYIIIYYI